MIYTQADVHGANLRYIKAINGNLINNAEAQDILEHCHDPNGEMWRRLLQTAAHNLVAIMGKDEYHAWLDEVEHDGLLPWRDLYQVVNERLEQETKKE